MSGRELLHHYIQIGDFSESEQDNYAQTLKTILANIQEKIFPLLEKAEKEGKRLAVKRIPPSETYKQDELQVSDIILE